MSIKTAIAWTDHTFNPWWGCVKIDPGCAHCYAETFSKRIGKSLWGPHSERRIFGDKHWAEPLAWNATSGNAILAADTPIIDGCRGPLQKHLVFSGSMCDWAEDHPTAAELRPRLFDLIRSTPWLDWQLLTKRADRIAGCLPSDWGAGYPNVWLGVSVSEPKGLWRVECLAAIPAAVHFLSYEPALENIADAPHLTRLLDWIIFGGESGPGYRKPAGWEKWALKLRDRARADGTAFFFKQSPAPRTEMGTTLEGQTIREFPKPR